MALPTDGRHERGVERHIGDAARITGLNRGTVQAQGEAGAVDPIGEFLADRQALVRPGPDTLGGFQFEAAGALQPELSTIRVEQRESGPNQPILQPGPIGSLGQVNHNLHESIGLLDMSLLALILLGRVECDRDLIGHALQQDGGVLIEGRRQGGVQVEGTQYLIAGDQRQGDLRTSDGQQRIIKVHRFRADIERNPRLALSNRVAHERFSTNSQRLAAV